MRTEILVAVLAVGCGSHPKHTRTTAAASATESTTAESKQSTQRRTKATAQPSRPDEIGVVSIADTPIKGELNGFQFVPSYVALTDSDGQWSLLLSTAKWTARQVRPIQSVRIVGLTPPRLGVQRRTTESGVIAHVRSTSDPGKTLVYAGRASYVLELTKWELVPNKTRCPRQPIGNASGRLIVVLHGTQNVEQSKVEGKFQNATIMRRDSAAVWPKNMTLCFTPIKKQP